MSINYTIMETILTTQMALASRFSAGVCGSTSSMRRLIMLLCEVGLNAAFLQILGSSISGHVIAVATHKVMGSRLQWAIMNRVLRQTGRAFLCLMQGSGKLARENPSFLMKVQVTNFIFIALVHFGQMLKLCCSCLNISA